MGTYMTYIYIVYTYILTQINMYTHSRISRADEEVIIELEDQYMGTYMIYIYIVYAYIHTHINMYTHTRIPRADIRSDY